MTAFSKAAGARDTGTKESCGLSGVMKRRERRGTDRRQTDLCNSEGGRSCSPVVWLPEPLLSCHGSQATVSVTVLAWEPSVFLELTSWLGRHLQWCLRQGQPEGSHLSWPLALSCFLRCHRPPGLCVCSQSSCRSPGSGRG